MSSVMAPEEQHVELSRGGVARIQCPHVIFLHAMVRSLVLS